MNKVQERLCDSIHTTCEIICSKCGKTARAYGWDEYMFAEDLENLRWYSTVNNVYCPECNKKRKGRNGI